MPAPKKADSDKIKQVKVHVKVSDLEKYDRKKIEQLIEEDKYGKTGMTITLPIPKESEKAKSELHVVTVDHSLMELLPLADSEVNLIKTMIPHFRKSKNQLYYINRAVQLR